MAISFVPRGLTLVGEETIRKRIQLLAGALPEKTAKAMVAEMKIMQTECRAITPKDTGALRDSIRVTEPVFWGQHIRVGLTAGGESKFGYVDYALYVHEDLEALHPVGEAKFIERPMRAARPFMAARVGARLAKDLK